MCALSKHKKTNYHQTKISAVPSRLLRPLSGVDLPIESLSIANYSSVRSVDFCVLNLETILTFRFLRQFVSATHVAFAQSGCSARVVDPADLKFAHEEVLRIRDSFSTL